MLLASLAYGVVSEDRHVELPDLQPFLALQLSLSAWGGEVRLVSLALPLLEVPARCTVTSRHVSSPHFTYLIRWTLTSVSWLSPLQLSPLGLRCSKNLSRSPSHYLQSLHYIVTFITLLPSRYLQLQLVAVADPLDHLQVSPELHVEGRVPAHVNFKSSFSTASL